MGHLAENLLKIRDKMAVTAAGCGRNVNDINLVAVSKTFPASAIREAFLAGQRCFGENYAQELRDKSSQLADLEINWHFIGHLQKNKVKYVAPVASVVETIDSAEIANELAKRSKTKVGCLIEINTGGESSKYGTNENNYIALAKHIGSLPNLELRGLMTIPPYEENPEKSRPYFQKLKKLLTRLGEELSPATPFTQLSMGMSHDFEVAIEEGATIVRIGTAIFGGRI